MNIGMKYPSNRPTWSKKKWIPDTHHTVPLRVGEETFTVVTAKETGQRHPYLKEEYSAQTDRVGYCLRVTHFSIFDFRKAQV